MSRYPSRVYIKDQLVEHGVRGWSIPADKANKNTIILNVYNNWKTEKEVFDFFEQICCEAKEVKLATSQEAGYVKLKSK